MPIPPEVRNEFAPKTWDKIEAFLKEFVVFTSHERARLDICSMLIDEKQNLLRDQMGSMKPAISQASNG